ncbi:hypothetical protein RJ640_012211 [Escallonia rubra]|uniref:Ion transport domain-containing protein n=1 Tax=Escallonia rubra TaxID=112253 RepID=A0AA88UFN4_9ASTE|nr:hypothetical protein RJ640_012211 [Escallonia rubra]
MGNEGCAAFFERKEDGRGGGVMGGSGYKKVTKPNWKTKEDINLDEFSDLCNAIALRFQKEDSLPIFERFPRVYHSFLSEKLKAFVRSPIFGYIIAFILVLNLAAVIIETTLDIENNSGQKGWQEVEFVFGTQKRVVICPGNGAEVSGFNGLPMRAAKAFPVQIEQKEDECSITVPWCVSNDGKLGVSGFGYRMRWSTKMKKMGLVIFGGIVNAGNPNLDATDLADDEYPLFIFSISFLDKFSYLLFNFNDYPNGMVTLFNLLVMGNWQVWMQSYKELTTAWSYVYFVSFYLITIMLLLNLVVAFVLEAFFAEMDLESSENCNENHDVYKYTNRMTKMQCSTKTRSQRIDLLLHHMLSAELDKTQCGSP